MDNKEQEKEKDTVSMEAVKDNYPNDYELLVQKLKSIKENITLLEKKFLNKEI
tara:strand:+ start:144 stop:302 length:159 start_codon:yes stop_codon:yes gene_type:complete